MNNRVLITGGAGFIGTNLCRGLLNHGYNVTILDSFIPQIHGGRNSLPADLQGRVKVFIGDVRDKSVVKKAIKGQSAIIHYAAETGTGQSMYQIDHYSSVNVGGTAVLCDLLVNSKHNVKTLIVASSRAIYGEGKYSCKSCGVVFPKGRTYKNVTKFGYSPICPKCGSSYGMLFMPTDEESTIHPASIYGITKQVQEQMVLMTAAMGGISGYALRYQNVYGPGQSLVNPYTGILSIFTRLALAGDTIYIFEDGNESRDFVYIDDVVAATIKCLQNSKLCQCAINVGSGNNISVLEVAKEIKRYFNSKSKIVVNGAFREGDIRHNCADLVLAKSMLKYSPQWNFVPGLHAFLVWAKTQTVQSSNTDYSKSLSEMRKRGLYR